MDTFRTAPRPGEVARHSQSRATNAFRDPLQASLATTDGLRSAAANRSRAKLISERNLAILEGF